MSKSEKYSQLQATSGWDPVAHRFGEVSCLETKNTPSLDECVNHLIVSGSQFLQQVPKDRLCTQWHTRFSPGRPRVRIPLIARKIPRKREASPQAIIGNLNDSSNIPHYRENENGDRLKLEAKLHMMPEGREYVQCGAASNPLVSTTEQWQLIMSSNHSFCIIKRLLPSCMLNKMS